jgi:iron complex outermembrane recepter protein
MNHFLCWKLEAGSRKFPKSLRLNFIFSSAFYYYLFSLLFFLFSLHTFSQEKKDSIKANMLDEVLVAAIRVNAKIPVTFSNLEKREIAKRNLGQDIPILMNYMPSVVTTSEAGAGVGYTSIRVRGSDATRVNVTINGIPYNDSESSGTFFVNLPDFASSLNSIQLQRGVGTSTNGAGTFGASLNMLTDSYSQKSSGEIASSIGTFDTYKNTVKFSTGLMNQHFEIAGRLSKISSNGYVDRAKSNLKSYFLQGTFVGKTTLIKALVFGGTEKTYLAWNGIDKETLKSDRTFNPSGAYTDKNGNLRFYENETDNYQQDHFQLHWNEKINTHFTTNLAFHYTKGKGYYENYNANAKWEDYNLVQASADSVTNLVDQKWLDNDFYGTTFSGNYKSKWLDFIVGGAINRYEGRHFGKVIWTQQATDATLGDRYYNDIAYKNDASVFAKINFQITAGLSLYGDLQYRNVTYKTNAIETGTLNEKFNFLNPKAGLNFDLNSKNSFYFSYAKANREPNRTDYKNGSPRPESLDDFELGWRFKAQKMQFSLNGFFMNYKNQLVLTGALDNVGFPIRANSGKSYRAGVELDATLQLHKKWTVQPNFTISENKNVDFITQKDLVIVNIGKTNIPYSPKFIAANALTFSPFKNIQFIALSKFVGTQYLSNLDDKNSKLRDYFVQDFNVNYTIPTKTIFKSIDFNLLVNNILNRKYESNGADYDGYVVYFPQAGSHFLLGVNLRF